MDLVVRGPFGPRFARPGDCLYDLIFALISASRALRLSCSCSSAAYAGLTEAVSISDVWMSSLVVMTSVIYAIRKYPRTNL